MRSRARRRRPLRLVPLHAEAHGERACRCAGRQAPGLWQDRICRHPCGSPGWLPARKPRASRERPRSLRKSRSAWPARRRPRWPEPGKPKAPTRMRRAADRRSRAVHRGVGRDSDQSRRSGQAGRAQPLSFPAHLPARRRHDALSVPARGRACTGRLCALRLSDEPISAIAFEAGFNDLSTFNRRFRRVMGATPRRYRSTKRRR